MKKNGERAKQSQGKENKSSYIQGIFAVLAAIIAGLFTVWAVFIGRNSSDEPTPPTVDRHNVADTLASAVSGCDDWLSKLTKSPDSLYAVGEGSSGNKNLSIEKAKQQARKEIAMQFEIHIRGMQKQTQKEKDSKEITEVFESSSESRVEAILNYSVVDRQLSTKVGSQWQSCVLIRCPIRINTK